MPTTEPFDYRLFAGLKAALRAISVANGYYYDVAHAAVKLDAEHGVEDLVAPNGPRPAIIIELRSEVWEYLGSGEVHYAIPATLHWLGTAVPLEDAVSGEPTPPDDEDRMRVYFRGLADIEKAITRDESLGGVSQKAQITDRRWNHVNGGQDVWAEVDVEFGNYRTYGAPS